MGTGDAPSDEFELCVVRGLLMLSVVRCARCEVRGARCKVRGARCEVRGARCEVRGARCEVRVQGVLMTR